MSTATSPKPSASQPATAGSLRVYSTLTRTKEPFVPVKPGKVGMYLCGPTVYKPSHIGHMVGPVIFDAIKRYLTYSGYKVTWVVNITDVDDKLINESQRARHDDGGAGRGNDGRLHAQSRSAGRRHDRPLSQGHRQHRRDHRAHADRSIDKGFAYASEGDVYFDVAKDTELRQAQPPRPRKACRAKGATWPSANARPADFALWKSAKPGEPAWDSPWGKGRPGWHIECSAMSRRILGETFDIHGGGLDLIFPHHENEIAQSECCHGKPQAKYWLHNGLMQAAAEAGKIGGRNTRPQDPAGATASANAAANPQGDLAAQSPGKISKSTGASAFRDLLDRHQPETIRFFLLSTHYRSPIQYSEELLQEAARSLENFYRFFKRYERVTGKKFFDLQAAATRNAGDFDPKADALLKEVAALRTRFLEAMDDDFNTGAATAALFELVRALNKYVDSEKLEAGKPDATQLATLEKGAAVLKELAGVLGLFRKPIESRRAGTGDDESLVASLVKLVTELQTAGKLADPAIASTALASTQADPLMNVLIATRAAARKNKDFATGDLIRNRLTELRHHARRPSRRHRVAPRVQLRQESGDRCQDGWSSPLVPRPFLLASSASIPA